MVRAARHAMPLMIAVISGSPSRFAPFVELFRRASEQAGFGELSVGVHAPGFVADTDAEARELYFPHFKAQRDLIGAERGWRPVTREHFEAEANFGALHIGGPDTVARKIADTILTLGLDRFDLKYSSGPLPHELIMHNIELYGTEVIPRVRALVARA